MSWRRAAEEGSVSELEGFLRAASHVDGLVEEGTDLTPLHYCAMEGHAKAVEMLLGRNVSVNKTDQFGRTALYLATLHQHRDVVGLLLAKADPNIVCDCKTSALSKAAEYGDRAVLRMLVDAGASLKTANQDGETPRILAARNGHMNLWDEYEERQRDRLVRAAREGNLDRVAMLVRSGADPFKTKPERSSPLEVASGAGRLAVVRFLLFDPAVGAAAPLARVEAMGKGALHAAAERGHEGVVDLILSTKLPPDTRDEKGNPAMHRAAARGRTKVVDVLLNRHADINAKGLLNMTPLHQAAKQRQTAMVAHLIGKGALQTEEDDMGRTFKDMQP